jgi:hypothetical protein
MSEWAKPMETVTGPSALSFRRDIQKTMSGAANLRRTPGKSRCRKDAVEVELCHEEAERSRMTTGSNFTAICHTGVGAPVQVGSEWLQKPIASGRNVPR